jgi:pyrimidine deaminase RibD-like protein
VDQSSNDGRLQNVLGRLREAWSDPLAGIVAAGIYDEKSDRSAIAVSRYEGSGRWRHAEDRALEAFVCEFGAPPASSIAVVTLAPCTHLRSQSRIGAACAWLLANAGIKHFYVGAIDRATYSQTEADYAAMGITVTETQDPGLRRTCGQVAQMFATFGAKINHDLPNIKKEVGFPDITQKR